MLPSSVDWKVLASGIIFVGVLVAFFLWFGGERFLRRLLKGKDAKYEPLRGSDDL
jgi:hypothetical protein